MGVGRRNHDNHDNQSIDFLFFYRIAFILDLVADFYNFYFTYPLQNIQRGFAIMQFRKLSLFSKQTFICAIAFHK